MESAVGNFALVDDIEVPLTADDYQDQSNPAPLPPGNYIARVKSFAQRFEDKEKTKPVLKDGKYPVFVLESIEIAEGEHAGRTVLLYQDIRTKPFERRGPRGITQASTFNDFVRSLDQTVTFSRLSEGIDEVKRLIGEGGLIRVTIDWQAYDSEMSKAEIAALGPNPEQAAKNAVYDRVQVRGYRKFPRNTDGSYSYVWQSPAGNPVEARPVVTRWFASLDPSFEEGVALPFRAPVAA